MFEPEEIGAMFKADTIFLFNAVFAPAYRLVRRVFGQHVYNAFISNKAFGLSVFGGG